MLKQGEAACRTGPHRQPPRAQPARRPGSQTARAHTRPRAGLWALAVTKPHLRANGDLAKAERRVFLLSFQAIGIAREGVTKQVPP